MLTAKNTLTQIILFYHLLDLTANPSCCTQYTHASYPEIHWLSNSTYAIWNVLTYSGALNQNNYDDARRCQMILSQLETCSIELLYQKTNLFDYHLDYNNNFWKTVTAIHCFLWEGLYFHITDKKLEPKQFHHNLSFIYQLFFDSKQYKPN